MISHALDAYGFDCRQLRALCTSQSSSDNESISLPSFMAAAMLHTIDITVTRCVTINPSLYGGASAFVCVFPHKYRNIATYVIVP